jgi:hypothetical protein
LINDWYGTSRELAAVLMESRRCCGRRSDMVFVVGLKLGSDLLPGERTKDFSAAAAKEIDGRIEARDGHGEVLLV